jgi:hypothetical protein
MRTRLLTVLTAASLAAAFVASVAIAAGPTPGFSPDGVLGPKREVQYVAVSSGGTTTVRAIRMRDATTLRSARLKGVFGVPQVAYDGSAGGVTHDGRLLVLATNPARSTRFVVLATKTLKVVQSFSLRGTWGYDAVSPEGKTLYLTQVLSQTDVLRYVVRAYDLRLHRLVAGAIADKSEPGAMAGFPVSRATSSSGKWAYTLYSRSGEKPFIHALNTQARVAICIDLDWKGDPNNLGAVHLVLSPDEKQLIVSDYTTGKAVLSIAAPR